MLYLTRGSEEKYAPLSDDTRDYFSRDDLVTLNSGVAARFDIIEHPSNNTNYVISGEQSKSTLYSSISNSSYNALLYDILRMPISIRNRVAMVADENPFQEYLMGVRYIQTQKDKVPAGYRFFRKKTVMSLLKTTAHFLLPMEVLRFCQRNPSISFPIRKIWIL